MNLTDEMLDHLSDAQYGAPETWKVEDSDLIVRVKVEIDQDTQITDDEFYGRFEQTRENSYGPVRPSDFDGRAEIISRDQAYALWWQPPTDVTNLDALRRDVRELLEYGYLGIVAELCEGTDGYGRLIVREVVSLWGIESTADDGDRREIISDLLQELGFQAGYDEPREG